MKLALHTWTLLGTPFAEILRVAPRAGWEGIELSRQSIAPNSPNALPVDEIAALLRASGLPVACLGVEPGWMWAEGDEWKRLLAAFDERCRLAVSLGCRIVMSPVDTGRGIAARAAESVHEVGDIAARHGVRLAVEFNSQAQLLNTLARARDLMTAADHPACGLLLDTYHLGRSGATLAQIEDVEPREIVYVQFSDVPRRGLRPGYALDRLPPGEGTFPFREFFALIRAKGYGDFMAYEAPNEVAWTRPAEAVAREALAATRAVL
ncbi:MAG: sugar phosphate isomerase/epimerase [Candidatus Rokubacteria bacterium]|nr:sugar phosphate isomerase/epimerase [Candidatus Rokubacteria bacterium]